MADLIHVASNDTPPGNDIVDVDALIASQLAHTAQTFPSGMTAGSYFIGAATRGPILPQYGTKERDRILRIFDQYEYNSIWQGAIAGLTKKVTSSPWQMTGDSEWTNFFQVVLQNAQFGKGWDVFLKRFLRDFFTQDYGAWGEKIGAGPTDGPILGPVIGIAHLDAGRCFVTGNPTWPIIYYSLITGALHRMHHSRVFHMVDMPNPDERYFGIGLCALSRCIGAANRQIRMGRYIDSFLDDKPKPGITAITGLTKQQFAKIAQEYLRKSGTDDGDIFGKILMLFSLDADKPVDVKNMPFAETPEKFDFVKWTDLDVNSVALGLGVDRLELWESAGRMLGSAQQSNIMAQKAEGKAFGDIISNITRLVNTEILPVGMEFEFRTRNTIVDSATGDNDLKLANSVHVVASIPNTVTPQEVRTILSSRSKTFENAFRKDTGEVDLMDDDVKLPTEESHLKDDAPPDSVLRQPIVMQTGGAGGNGFGSGGESSSGRVPSSGNPGDGGNGTQGIKGGPSKQVNKNKEFIDTKGALVQSLVNMMSSTSMTSRQRFGMTLRSNLLKSGTQAFKDGLEKGGVKDELDSHEKNRVRDWMVSRSSDASGLANMVYAKEATSDEIVTHAQKWVDTHLSSIYHDGLAHADRNGLYTRKIGKSCKGCPDCERLDNQTHRLKEWHARGLVPGGQGTDCEYCDCSLMKTKGLSKGRF